MIDLEKTLLDICLPLVDDQKALSVKTMATTNDILVVGLVRDHNKNDVKFDDYKILNDFKIYDI